MTDDSSEQIPQNHQQRRHFGWPNRRFAWPKLRFSVSTQLERFPGIIAPELHVWRVVEP